jgi:hypothetical protein
MVWRLFAAAIDPCHIKSFDLNCKPCNAWAGFLFAKSKEIIALRLEENIS